MFFRSFSHYALCSRYYKERRHFLLETPYTARVCNAAVRFARHGSLRDVADVRALMVPFDNARNFALLGTLSLDTVRADDDRLCTLITHAIGLNQNFSLCKTADRIHMPELLDPSIAWIWMEMPARAFATVITRLRQLPTLSSATLDITRVGRDSYSSGLEDFVRRAHTTVTVTVLMFARLERYPHEVAGLYRTTNIRSRSAYEVFLRALRDEDTCVAAVLSPFCRPNLIHLVLRHMLLQGEPFFRRNAHLRSKLVREHTLPVGAGSNRDSVAYRAFDCIFAMTSLDIRSMHCIGGKYMPIESRACCSAYADDWSRRLARLAAVRKSALVKLAESTRDPQFAEMVACYGIETALRMIAARYRNNSPLAAEERIDEYTRASGRYFARIGWCFLATALDFKRDLCTRCYSQNK